jgi:hypothetical protein
MSTKKKKRGGRKELGVTGAELAGGRAAAARRHQQPLSLADEWTRLRSEQQEAAAGYSRLDEHGRIDQSQAPRNQSAAERIVQLITDSVLLYICYLVMGSTMSDYLSIERGWMCMLRLGLGVVFLALACVYFASVAVGYASQSLYMRGVATVVDMLSDVGLNEQDRVRKARRQYPDDVARQKLHQLELSELRSEAYRLGCRQPAVKRAMGSVCRQGGCKAAKADMIELIVGLRSELQAGRRSALATERASSYKEAEQLEKKAKQLRSSAAGTTDEQCTRMRRSSSDAWKKWKQLEEMADPAEELVSAE